MFFSSNPDATCSSGADAVPSIAVLDNDRTLWPEAPVPFQAAFVFDLLKPRSPSEPKLAADRW